MPTDRELLQQALPKIVDCAVFEEERNGLEAAKETWALYHTIRARLAQPEHDLYTTADKDRPDVICDRNGEVVLNLCKRCGRGEAELIDQPCSQPEPEPVAYDKSSLNAFVQDLFDEKMREGKHGHYETMFHVVHQAIKRVHANTKPFAWVHWITSEGEQFPQLTLVPRTNDDTPLYIAPPRREWQGLTDEDFREHCKTLPPLWNTYISRTYAEEFFYAGATKLREKNA